MSGYINSELLSYFQVYWNLLDRSNESIINDIILQNKKVMLRSIFMHGSILNSNSNIKKDNIISNTFETKTPNFENNKDLIYDKTLSEAFKLNTDKVIVGLTKKEQLDELYKYI